MVVRSDSGGVGPFGSGKSCLDNGNSSLGGESIKG